MQRLRSFGLLALAIVGLPVLSQAQDTSPYYGGQVNTNGLQTIHSLPGSYSQGGDYYQPNDGVYLGTESATLTLGLASVSARVSASSPWGIGYQPGIGGSAGDYLTFHRNGGGAIIADFVFEVGNYWLEGGYSNSLQLILSVGGSSSASYTLAHYGPSQPLYSSGPVILPGLYTLTTGVTFDLDGETSFRIGAGVSAGFAFSIDYDHPSASAGIDSLRFVGVTNVRDANSGLLLSDVTFTSVSGVDYAIPSAVPEPSTYALIGGLVALLGAAVHRRRSRCAAE